MLMPFMRAASKTLVPSDTRTGWPSRMMSTKPGGVVTLVILGANTNALGFASAGRGGETDSARALTLQHVRIHFGAKMFQNRLNGARRDMAETADGGEASSLREFIKEPEVGAILGLRAAALRPARKHVRHFLRADAARYALSAGFVAIEAHCVQGHVQHASRIVADDDRSGTQHGAGFAESLEIKTNVDHRRGKIPGRRPGGRESLELTAAANSASVIENDLTHGRSHRHFENAWACDLAADADKFQAARATGALCDKPVNPASEYLRNVDESFHIVDDRGFLPQADLSRERRLIARLGAMALDGFDERAFFATDIAARTDKHLQVVVEVASQNFLSEKRGTITAANLFTEDFFLKVVFVADIKDAPLCARDKSGNDHALDQEMRQICHDKAGLVGAGLSFVGVADDVFDGIGLLADKVPLHAGRKPGTAHAFKFGGFELCEDVVPSTRLNEFSHDAVLLAIAIGIGFARDARLLGMRHICPIAAHGAAGH